MPNGRRGPARKRGGFQRSKMSGRKGLVSAQKRRGRKPTRRVPGAPQMARMGSGRTPMGRDLAGWKVVEVGAGEALKYFKCPKHVVGGAVTNDCLRLTKEERHAMVGGIK